MQEIVIAEPPWTCAREGAIEESTSGPMNSKVKRSLEAGLPSMDRYRVKFPGGRAGLEHKTELELCQVASPSEVDPSMQV